jgi:hypothetical protein
MHFYRNRAGFDELSRFEDHARYDGVMLGLPDAPYHLELTQRTRTDGTATTKKGLGVLDLRIPSALAWLRGALHEQRVSARPSAGPVLGRTGRGDVRRPDRWHLILVPGRR